jgi:hypothetical protein
MATDEEVSRQWRTLSMIVYALMLVAPVLYLVVVLVVAKDRASALHPVMQIVYLCLAMALLMAIVIPIVEKRVVAAYAVNRPNGMSILEAAQAIVIIKLALIETTYIYGLVTFFVNGVTTYLPYFYALGILYSILFWPSKSRFTELVRKLEAK